MIKVGRDMHPTDMTDRIGRDDPLILECGCHDGRDTAIFLEAFPKCRIVCFEPDPRPIQRHDPAGFLDRIGDDARVTLVRAAVSDRNGVALLKRSSGTPPGTRWTTHDWDHSSSILEPTGHLADSPWCSFPQATLLWVPVVSLDSWIGGHPDIQAIDLIWADVQGAEALLIAGAKWTLERTHWFYTEYAEPPLYDGQPSLQNLCDSLPDFDLLATYGSNALFSRKHNG